MPAPPPPLRPDLAAAGSSTAWEPGLATALLPAILVGAFLRTHHLGRQIPGGDELHVLRAMLELSWRELFTTYREADYCQPLAILYRLLAKTGIELHEGWLRLPVVTSSIALLALGPLALRPVLPRPAVVTFGWVLALCPPLVLHGRLLRGYAPATLLSLFAVLAFYHWWRRPALGWGIVYALAAALAVAFHLLSAPTVAAPLAFAAAWRALRREGPRWPEIGLLAFGALAAVSLVLAPAGSSLWALLADKAAHGGARPATTWLAVAQLQLGCRSLAGALAAAGFVALGTARLLRQRRSLALLIGCCAAGQVAALILLDPAASRVPLVMSRYLLFLSPFGALCGAIALSGLSPRLSGRRSLAIAGGLGLWVALGPWTDPAVRRGDFLGHNLVLSYDRPRPALPTAAVPAIYHRLAAGELPGAVLELPLGRAWSSALLFPLYQDLHRRPVLAAWPSDGFERGGLRLRRLLPPRLDRLLASEARLLVVHRQLSREQATLFGERPAVHRGGSAWSAIDEAGRRAEAAARLAWGPPDCTDAWVAVWDLERVRRRTGGD